MKKINCPADLIGEKINDLFVEPGWVEFARWEDGAMYASPWTYEDHPVHYKAVFVDFNADGVITDACF